MSLLVALMLTLTLPATEATAPSPTPAPPAMMFVLDVGGDHVPLPTREALTEAFALSLARQLDLDVQSPRSLLDRVDFAQQQQQAGCDSSACMAEIANAMGARFVVFSRIVRLGDEETLRADIYDNVEGRTLALASVRSRAVDDLHRQLPTLVEALVRESTGALPLRAVERPIAVAADAPMSSNMRSGLLLGGVGAGAVVVFGSLFGLGTMNTVGVSRASEARGPFDATTLTLGTCGSGCLGVGGLLALLVGAGVVGADALAPSAEEATR
jgi:hypothetical protein